ncbi:MAG: GntR family transcriptional regulator [Desulfobacterales bacterium]|nr:GntR family transcriptional regulator [Desulfobacterales bacterium]
MMQIKKIDNQLMSTKIYHALLDMMTRPEILEKGKLPRESEIIELLGVSRTSLRDALALLEKDVIITRRRGFGTFINREVLALKNRLDVKKEFNALIKDAGYDPSLKYVETVRVQADKEVSQALAIQPGENLYKVTKLLAGDGTPMIYCSNYVPEAFLPDGTFPEKEKGRPIYELLEKYCDIRIHHEISQITPVLMTAELEKIFELPPSAGMTVQYFTEVAYDIDSRPVMYSEFYHRSDLIRQTIVRS